MTVLLVVAVLVLAMAPVDLFMWVLCVAAKDGDAQEIVEDSWPS